MAREHQERKKTPPEITQYISVQSSIGSEYPTTSNTTESSQLNQLIPPDMPAPGTGTLATQHVNSELSTSTPANLLSVPAPTNAPLEVLPALLQANQPCLQLASAVISRSLESASQASVPKAAQAAVSLTNFRTIEARLQSASVSRASMSQDVAEFWVKPLTNRIKKCAGCGGPYVNELCADICVATEDIYTHFFFWPNDIRQ